MKASFYYLDASFTQSMVGYLLFSQYTGKIISVLFSNEPYFSNAIVKIFEKYYSEYLRSISSIKVAALKEFSWLGS